MAAYRGRSTWSLEGEELRPEIFWIRDIEPLRFGIMGRPRAGEWLADEIASWRSIGVSTVVSLLQPSEVKELELGREPDLCASHDIEFISFGVDDRGTPERATEFLALSATIAAKVRGGAAVAAHCRAGIGRSGLFAACVLRELGIPAADAFELLTRARGAAVPDTPDQIAWFAAHRKNSASPSHYL